MTVSTQRKTNRAWLEVDLANLVANARTVQEAAGGAALLPMVKADGYGLGAVPAARALETLDPWGFGVATVEEGAALRAAGIRRPILVFTPAIDALWDAYARHDLRAVIDEPNLAARWNAPFHLEIDTGMGRCGVRWDAQTTLGHFDVPHLEGAFTHFFAADTDSQTVEQQWARFRQALTVLPQRKLLLHAANSAAAFSLGETLDLVRPGIFLYGGRAGTRLPEPRPVGTVRAPVVSLRTLHRGETVSYGGDWAASRRTTIATLGIGYADGIPRAIQGRAHVLLSGVRRPIVGRVTMDLVMIDLASERTSVGVGEVATVIGRDGGDEITVDEFAGWAKTISYEILTGLGGRMRREYLGP